MHLFREIQTLQGLLLSPEEKRWLEKPQAQPSSRATVLYLGCNILRTPHLAQTVTAFFRCLGEDFIALGGAAYCCGVPYEREVGIEGGRRQGERLASRLEQLQPKQVVMWCPGCLHFYRHVLSLSGSFQLLHVTEFLAENRDKLTFTPQPPTKVTLHCHTGSPESDRQAAAARALLAAVPGVELVDIGSSDAWGRNCSGVQRDRMGREAWEAVIKPFFDKAAAAGADVFATMYHGCQRMYAGYQDDYPFTIEHYLTVVGRALGINYPDKYKQYLLWKDRGGILEDSYPCMEANRVRREQAIATIDRVFVADGGL